jgi:hypothetical protein
MKTFVGFTAVAIAVLSGSVYAASVCSNATMDGTRILSSQSSADGAYYDVDGGAIDEGYGSPALVDDISFQFYNLGAGFHTGSINLATGDDSNYQTCSECLLVFQDFNDSTNQYTKAFFQSQGVLTIDPTTPPGSDPIILSWSNVKLVEVTIDPNTFISTPVPNGACYNIVSDTVFANGFESLPSG